jgi:hypothetical protein
MTAHGPKIPNPAKDKERREGGQEQRISSFGEDVPRAAIWSDPDLDISLAIIEGVGHASQFLPPTYYCVHRVGEEHFARAANSLQPSWKGSQMLFLGVPTPLHGSFPPELSCSCVENIHEGRLNEVSLNRVA